MYYWKIFGQESIEAGYNPSTYTNCKIIILVECFFRVIFQSLKNSISATLSCNYE